MPIPIAYDGFYPVRYCCYMPIIPGYYIPGYCIPIPILCCCPIIPGWFYPIPMTGYYMPMTGFYYYMPIIPGCC